jgi:hypothetical protein
MSIFDGLFTTAERTGPAAIAGRQLVPPPLQEIPQALSQAVVTPMQTSARPNNQQVAPVAVPQAAVPYQEAMPQPTAQPANTTQGLLQTMMTIPNAYEGDLAGMPTEVLTQVQEGYAEKIPELEAKKAALIEGGERETSPIIQGIQSEIDKSISVVGESNAIATERVAELAKKDTGIDAVIKKAAVEDGTKIAEEIGGENVAKVQEAASAIDKAVEDGFSVEEAMKGAGGFLGDLFKDPAIQRALIYYTGSRLMGYSGSGSGMAAGQVLLQGWSNQDKQKAANDKAAMTMTQKKAANDALDMSKTVSMWDPKTRQVQTGYMSKSGKFQSSQGGAVVNAKDYGLETYNKGQHKTFDEIDNTNIASAQGAAKDVLANISGNSDIYDEVQQQTAQALFADGSAINETLGLVTRSARSSKIDTSTPQFQTAVSQSIRKYMMSSIRNPEDTFDGSVTAGMADAIQADWIKADLTSEGGVPKHVFGKGSWTADGVSSMEEGYELPNKAVSKLMKQTKSVNNALVSAAVEGGYTREEANATITQTKTIQKLGNIFTKDVMSSKVAREHWTQVAEKTNTNAFNAWLSTTGTDVEDKYLGRLNPLIKSKVNTLYKEKDFK